MAEPHLLIAALSIALVSGFAQGVTGFGYVMVAAPLMSALADPKLFVPALIVQTSVTNVLILWHAHRHLRLRRVWLLATAGMIGVPFGTVALVFLDASVLRLVIGAVVALAAVGMLAGFRRAFRHETLASAPAGFMSGALNSSTGLAGPPVVLFYTNQDVEPHQFRANVVAHFTMLNVITIPSFVLGGLFGRDVVVFSAQLLPATLLGVGGGIVASRYLRDAVFRRVTLLLVLFAGLTAIATGLRGL